MECLSIPSAGVTCVDHTLRHVRNFSLEGLVSLTRTRTRKQKRAVGGWYCQFPGLVVFCFGFALDCVFPSVADLLGCFVFLLSQILNRQHYFLFLQGKAFETNLFNFLHRFFFPLPHSLTKKRKKRGFFFFFNKANFIFLSYVILTATL